VLYAGIEGDDDPPMVKTISSENGRSGVEIRHKGRTCQLLFDSGTTPGGDVIISGSDGNILLEKRLTTTLQPQSGIGN